MYDNWKYSFNSGTLVIPSSFIFIWNGIGKGRFIRLWKDIKSKPEKWIKFTYRIENEQRLTNEIRWLLVCNVSCALQKCIVYLVAVDDFSWTKMYIECRLVFDTLILSLWLNVYVYEHGTVFDVPINEKNFNLIEWHHMHTRNLLRGRCCSE